MEFHHNGTNFLLQEDGGKGMYFWVLPHIPSDNSALEASILAHVSIPFAAESPEEAIELARKEIDVILCN